MEDLPPQAQYQPRIVSWEASEFHFQERTADWFWGLGIVALTCAVISVLLGNPIFAIFIVLAGFTLAMLAHQKPKLISVEINRKGIVMHNTLYRFDELESFWIEDEGTHPKILLKSKKLIMPYVIVPLGEVSPDEIHPYLASRLKEAKMSEPLTQRVLEYLGF